MVKSGLFFKNAPVAHLDRVSASEAEGNWFESSRAHQTLVLARRFNQKYFEMPALLRV